LYLNIEKIEFQEFIKRLRNWNFLIDTNNSMLL